MGAPYVISYIRSLFQRFPGGLCGKYEFESAVISRFKEIVVISRCNLQGNRMKGLLNFYSKLMMNFCVTNPF